METSVSPLNSHRPPVGRREGAIRAGHSHAARLRSLCPAFCAPAAPGLAVWGSPFARRPHEQEAPRGLGRQGTEKPPRSPAPWRAGVWHQGLCCHSHYSEIPLGPTVLWVRFPSRPARARQGGAPGTARPRQHMACLTHGVWAALVLLLRQHMLTDTCSRH